MKYEPVIGLEVHSQLNTKSKIFCGCSTEFGAAPNTQTCPICLGMPGVLPVLNREVVAKAMRAALALNCTINEVSRWARKNYFYPDLPKGYQISQYEQPLAVNGHIDIVANGAHKRIRIHRIHMEEDAGKNIHGENLGDPAHSYVDLNRTGVPLIEIVSEADMRNSEEAKAYLEKLHSILRYTGVSDCNMEEGSFRADANVSVRPFGQEKFGTKAEVKNVNSFRFIQKAIDYEIERQSDLLDDGGRVIQETRLWDSVKNITVSMRSKEEANDYRYFPDPDLVPLRVSEEWKNEVAATLPELPDAKIARFQREYGIPEYDAVQMAEDQKVAHYFEAVVKMGSDPKTASNWIMTDVLRILKERQLEIEQCPVTAAMLHGMLELIKNGTISGKLAKDVFAGMEQTGKDAKTVVAEKGLVQISDTGELEKIVDGVIAANPDNAAQYKAGKVKLMGFFVGQVMQASKGKANPALVNKILKEKLG